LAIWNCRDGSRRNFIELESDIDDIRFGPDGNFIVGGMSNGDVLLWNVRTGQMVEKVVGCCGRLTKVALAFTPDGTRLIGSLDRTVKFWDVSLFGMDGSGSQPEGGRMGAEKITGMKELLDFKGHRVCRLAF
jgi:WD40 repeat protein